MILLLTLITLRSALWNIFQLIHQQNYGWLLAIAISAFAGKILGGFISDRIGWRLYNFVSLLAAAPLVSFFKNELLLFCIGVALLQSGVPANTAMLLVYMKEEKGKAVALAFGAGVFLAGSILFFPAIHQHRLWDIGFFVVIIKISGYIFMRPKNQFVGKVFS
jgi:FSR family fosmidomycin resistance protein-like MFS transporter